MEDFDAQQVVRQRLTAALLARVSRDDRFGTLVRHDLFGSGHRLCFIEQPELVDWGPLAACAEAPALEQSDVLLERADVFGFVCELRLLFEDDLAQRFDVSGK